MAFSGIGWTAMHTDLSKPAEDLLVLFKSSPFGQDSHSHADQNSFAILKGGLALALPSGSRFPQQGSPFHTKYTTQTIAHNTLLINGKGQIEKDESATGQLIAFKSLPHIAYAAGQAQKCYGAPVTSYVRHLVFIRPSIVLIVDDVEATEPVHVDWLMHGKEQFDLDEGLQAVVSHRQNALMKMNFLTTTGLAFHQDDVWPIDPKEGYPMVTEEPPTKQWHFRGTVREKSRSIRIATLMSIGEKGNAPEIDLKKSSSNTYEIKARFAGIGQAKITLNLAEGLTTSADEAKLIDIRYEPQTGAAEHFSIPNIH
jgi:hypothetical protein